MIKAVMIVGALATATLATFACSSNSNNAATSCLASANGATSECVSCVESKCGSQLNALDSACSAYISCACPGGTYSQSAATSSSCVANEMASGCETADNNVGSCVTSNCSSQCTSSSSSGSGSSSGSTSSSGSSSSGGTPTGTCASLATCCGMLPSADQAGCNDLADENNQTLCQAELGGFDDAGLCH